MIHLNGSRGSLGGCSRVVVTGLVVASLVVVVVGVVGVVVVVVVAAAVSKVMVV